MGGKLYLGQQGVWRPKGHRATKGPLLCSTEIQSLGDGRWILIPKVVHGVVSSDTEAMPGRGQGALSLPLPWNFALFLCKEGRRWWGLMQLIVSLSHV